jgi:plastocyanin
MTSSQIGGLLFLSLAAGAAHRLPAQAPGSTPQVIEVIANDYAFSPLPARIAAGPTVFTFANKGTVQHEMSIGRLRNGATLDDLLKVSREGGRMRDVMERSVGILIAGGGKSPDGRLLVDLLAGQTYVVLCNLKDRPDSPPHMTLGMYTTFRPQ